MQELCAHGCHSTRCPRSASSQGDFPPVLYCCKCTRPRVLHVTHQGPRCTDGAVPAVEAQRGSRRPVPFIMIDRAAGSGVRASGGTRGISRSPHSAAALLTGAESGGTGPRLDPTQTETCDPPHEPRTLNHESRTRGKKKTNFIPHLTQTKTLRRRRLSFVSTL